jgi:hypothetical protein
MAVIRLIYCVGKRPETYQSDKQSNNRVDHVLARYDFDHALEAKDEWGVCLEIALNVASSRRQSK